MCRLLFIALLSFFGCTSSLAQWDDEEPECDHVPEGKAMKWLQKGQNGSKYERSERVEFLEAAFEEDEYSNSIASNALAAVFILLKSRWKYWWTAAPIIAQTPGIW